MCVINKRTCFYKQHFNRFYLIKALYCLREPRQSEVHGLVRHGVHQPAPASRSVHPALNQHREAKSLCQRVDDVGVEPVGSAQAVVFVPSAAAVGPGLPVRDERGPDLYQCLCGRYS